MAARAAPDGSLSLGCGSAGGGQQGSESAGHGEHGTAEKTGGMGRMDHSNMDHGSMGMGSKGMARQMVPHHQGAIEMAQVASKRSKISEIEELAGSIMCAQKREIEQMRRWRE